MRALLLAVAVAGCSFEHGQLAVGDAGPDGPDGSDAHEPPSSCKEVAGPTGVYQVDVGAGPIDVLCEQSLDDGGWSLIASFVNNDGVRNWESLASLDAPSTFGALATHESADYKSSLYGTLMATDLLVVTEEYSFAFHGVLGNRTFSAFVTASWPATCSVTWLREGADFTLGLTSDQAKTLGVIQRGTDINDSRCFPQGNEVAAIAFMAGDSHNYGLANAPVTNVWGTVDLSLPKLANFSSVGCTPTLYPCNGAYQKVLWNSHGTAVKALRALVFVR